MKFKILVFAALLMLGSVGQAKPDSLLAQIVGVGSRCLPRSSLRDGVQEWAFEVTISNEDGYRSKWYRILSTENECESIRSFMNAHVGTPMRMDGNYSNQL